MFTPIERTDDLYPNRLYEKIIESIKEMILQGKLKSGEKLPSERELAESFKVSRVPVREALKVLEFMGVVQNLRGEGMVIRQLKIEDLIEYINFSIECPQDTIDELFEARQAVEIKAVYLAAIKRTASDIKEMEEAIKEMAKEIAQNNDVSVASLKFHDAIIKASKNKVLYKINELLRELLKISRSKSLTIAGRPKVALEYHEQILQKIKDKDPSGAVICMEEHLNNAENAVVQLNGDDDSNNQEK